MHDSTTAADIPADAEMVAGYIDGKFAWKQADWDRFPNVPKVRIAVKSSTNDGDVLDVEPGDAVPADAPGWILMRQAAGYARPTIYCMASMADEVRRACIGLDFDLWIADYTGVVHNDSRAVATQYANPDFTGKHFDLSVVMDDGWPHRTGDEDLNPEQDARLRTIESSITAMQRKLDAHLSETNDFLALRLSELRNDMDARLDAIATKLGL